MANPLEHVAWEPCLIEPRPDRALESYARRRMGMPNPALRYFGPVPWLTRALIDLHPEYGLLVHLDQDVADLVGLVVSQENSCRYCFAASRALLWLQGMKRERIQRLEQDLSRTDLPPATQAAIALGRSQSRKGPAGMRTAWQAMRRLGVRAEELKEIAFTVATCDFSNRVHTIPAIPARPVERLPEQFMVRLMRPFLDRMLRRHRVRGREIPLQAVPSYPYAKLVAAYAGSPIGPALGRTLEEMWASRHLSRRCKLLMFAVIACGLPCEVCVTEVSEALVREGLPAPTIAQILAHLDAPELDPVERLLVPFARETIWYEPAEVQRRARALRGPLSDEQLIEAIGVAALANGLCRMAATVIEDPS